MTFQLAACAEMLWQDKLIHWRTKRVNKLRFGADIPVTLSDGIDALAMAEAATQSAKTGLPVKLSSV
jgi:hydroxypyruvate isomerase